VKRIRVAHVINQLALGGMEYNVLKLLNRIDRDRFEPVIVSLRGAFDYARELAAPDIPIWEMNRREGLDLGLIVRLARRLRLERIDIVHSHNWSTYLYATLSARLAGVRVVVHGEHGLEVDTLVENPRRTRARRVLARVTDRFVGVSREICERVERWGGRPDRISYIPNGVDLTRFGQPYPRNEIRASLSIEPEEPVVAGIGACRPVKDFGTLVRAFGIVLRRHPDAWLLLIGADPGNRFERKLRSEIPESDPMLRRTRLLGRRLDTPELLSAIDVYVNSSVYEGMSNTVLESMASRTPVVATAVGGTPDLIQDGVTGLLAPPSDPEALADRVLRLLADREYAASLAQRARRQIERNHSFDRMIALNEDLYDTVHDEKVGRRGLRSAGKAALSRTAVALGIASLAERSSRGSLTVLTYHRILPLKALRRYWSRPMILPADVFDRQMAELARRYRALSLAEVVDHYKSGTPFPDRAVHVTFDDGYADNFEFALPILAQHSIPATFFLTTGPIDEGTLLWWDSVGHSLLCLHGSHAPDPGPETFGERRLHRLVLRILGGEGNAIPMIDHCIVLLNFVSEDTRSRVIETLARLADSRSEEPPPRLMLTWEQVREMRRQGMTLGGHTVRHAFLSELDDAAGRREVSDCLCRIEQETGVRPRVFSYPAGRTGERTRPWFEEARVELAMTTLGGRNRSGDDRYRVQRWDAGYLTVQSRFVRSQMRLELSGAMDWVARLRSYRPGA
jgi:sugar transferase (PEP-CTERM/EpsH1 system associated)